MEWIEVKKEKHQIKNCIWVECIAEIKKNDTGEIREYETHEILELGDEHPSAFNWEENNFSCDCNRVLFFKRAADEETDTGDRKCTDGKYSVNLKNKKDGKMYYCEYST